MQFTAREIEDFSHSSTDCLVLPVPENPKRLQGVLAAADKLAAGLLRQVLDSGDFSGKKGQHTTLYLPKPARIRRLLLVGTGKAPRKGQQRHDFLEWSRLVGQCLHRLQAADATIATAGLPAVADDPAWAARQLAQAISAAQYRYDATLSAKAPKPVLRKITVLGCGDGMARIRQALKTGHAIAEGIHLAKELGNLPGNICTPSYLAAEARKLAKRHKAVSCQVLDERKMRELGMGSFLSVTRGSEEPARLVVLQYQGAARTQKPVVLVGKGITFDSGGISLKPGAKMDEMKYDMCGAASVLGTLQAAATLDLPINVVGIIAAAENLPSGSATKPGDIVTSMSGKTIEILNTDAEGRLVLCDALTYAARFKPDTVIDIATLTGACVVALGEHASGLFSNDDDLADELLAAGQDSGDRAWRMPLWSDYQKQLKSPFADIANIGGPSAGSITAACFLARFTEDYTWAHLDIAGTAWQSSPKTATGRPVALLCQYLLRRAGAA